MAGGWVWDLPQGVVQAGWAKMVARNSSQRAITALTLSPQDDVQESLRHEPVESRRRQRGSVLWELMAAFHQFPGTSGFSRWGNRVWLCS